MSRDHVVSASLEDYLEAIFHIAVEKGAARAKDIADRLDVKGSSVTGALRNLADKGMVNYVPYDIITLTGEGQRVARQVVRRHEVLRHFLVDVLLIDETVAEEEACKLEHAISCDVSTRLVLFLDFLKTRQPGGAGWIREFGSYCKSLK